MIDKEYDPCDFEKLFSEEAIKNAEDKYQLTDPPAKVVTIPAKSKYGNETVGKAKTVSGSYWHCKMKFTPSKNTGIYTCQIYRDGEFLIYGKDYTLDGNGEADVHEKDGKFKFSNITFGSKAELSAYVFLWHEFLAGKITSLECQKSYTLSAYDKKICSYRADFVITKKDGTVDVVDVKGAKTDVFIIKAKLFEAQYGFAIKTWGVKGEGWINY